MCEDCGCEEKIIHINKSVHEHNNEVAHKLWHKFQKEGMLCVNVVGGPGSGKTSLIEEMGKFLEEVCVIQGDLESDIDKQRLEKQNISTFQINTHSGCHLTANLIKEAINQFDTTGKKYLFIENVGNLVCPAGVKLGECLIIVVSSTAEGGDKPKKYPIIFRGAKAVVITKHDLAAHVDFNQTQYLMDLNEINPNINIFMTTTRKKSSFKEIAIFLKEEREALLEKHHDH